MKSKVALARCSNYNFEQVDKAVRKSIDLLGGIKHIIKPNSKVLIKPNLLTDSAPEECITTHPRVIESIIGLVKTTNSEIYVGDSSGIIGQKVAIDRVYEVCGIKEICQRHNVKLAYFDKAILKNNIPITEWIEFCDYIINVPKFKTHGLTILTGAVKNMFGLVMGIHKVKLHGQYFDINDFSKKLVDIFQLASPVLSVVDAVVALEGDGPGSAGRRTDTELILASQDAVALDSVLATIMGLFPSDIPTTREASFRGLGESDINNIDIEGENIGEFIFSNFKLPKTSKIYLLPPLFRKMAKQLIWFRMQVMKDSCRGCRRCIDICPVGAVILKEDKAFVNSKRCILCSCCQEICPYKAINLKKSLLLRMAGI